VVVCCVSGLRGRGHCGVEAHWRRSCVVTLGGGFWLVRLAMVCLFPQLVVWYFSVSWCGVGAGVPIPEAGGVVSFG
jgi:hypothetical protein